MTSEVPAPGTEAVARLLSIASPPLGGPVSAAEAGAVLAGWGSVGRELAEILGRKNGFYAFESALLVRPLRQAVPPLGLVEWNAGDLWKDQHGGDATDLLFFAEDVFGGQWCTLGEVVSYFEPETGEMEAVAASVEEWASEIEYGTGFPVAHEWQVRHGALKPGQRLLPKLPFVVGGEYKVENLYALNDVDGLGFRASIASQIRDVPDGGQIVFEIRRPGD